VSGVVNRLFHGETKIDFIGRRKVWFAISGVVIAICIGSLVTSGLNYGIEFEGGVSIDAPIPDDGPLGSKSDSDVIAAIRDVLAPFNATDAQIQVATDTAGRSVIVQTKEIADPVEQDKVVNAVADATGADLADVDSQRVGSKWGSEITKKAIRALIIFVLVVLAFISLRFEFKMAVSAIAALIHDLIITAGIYSLVGFEVTPSTVIAILTILGYSLYDTVVVFDKVEENTSQYAATGRMTYQDSANLAMNQVFMRSLNTSLATLLPVASLLFVGAGLLGATTLEDLALALFVGILTGTYSSIFVATPILSLWKETEPRYRNIREKVLRDAKKSALQPVAATAGSAEAAVEGAAAATSSAPTSATSTVQRPPTRPRAGSKKSKRRKRR
jgi:preprotein translocase subunit SecF